MPKQMTEEQHAALILATLAEWLSEDPLRAVLVRRVGPSFSTALIDFPVRETRGETLKHSLAQAATVAALGKV